MCERKDIMRSILTLRSKIPKKTQRCGSLFLVPQLLSLTSHAGIASRPESPNYDDRLRTAPRTTESITENDYVAFFHQFFWITNNPALTPFEIVPCPWHRGEGGVGFP